MAAKKKAQKVTKVPSGASFTFTPRPIAGRTRCPDCGKGHTVMFTGSFPTCNGQTKFRCSKRCGWERVGKFQHTPTKKQKMPKPKAIKKQHGITDPPELRDAVRAEFHKRRNLCLAEREKFPPSLIEKKRKITKGKNKGKTITYHVSNPKFTDAMRDHMHKFQFSPESIRDEIKGV